MNSRIRNSLYKIPHEARMQLHYIDAVTSTAKHDRMLKRTEPSWNGHILFSILMIAATLVLACCVAP